MRHRYVTADVFTNRVFGGNPVAVVLDAAGLSVEQMQAITCEFNYSETTFVLPPLLAERLGTAEGTLRVGQGTDMGRPSLMLARTKQENGGVVAFVGGR